MGLTVSTIAASTRLTTKEAVRAELGVALAPATDDSIIDTAIDQASAAIRSYVHWDAFGREVVTETTPGFGDTTLQLRRTPVVKVSSVVDRNSNVITDYSVEDPDKGWIYRRAGWFWTVEVYPGLAGGGQWLDMGIPLPRSEEPFYSVAYYGGYILPEQNIIASVGISASSADNSFNSSSEFPALLVAGDILKVSGFADPANNGRFVVDGTPTASKIVVTSTLVTEAAAATRSTNMFFQPPANVRPFDDLEKACIETVKDIYRQRRDDPSVVEKQVGQMRIRKGEQLGVVSLPLPSRVVALLQSWMRAA